MSFYDMVDFGMAFCENFDDFPDAFTFNGNTYMGFYDDTLIAEQLSDGGYPEEINASLLVRKESFKNVVVPIDNIEGQSITVHGRTLTVSKVKDDRVSFLFYLIDGNR